MGSLHEMPANLRRLHIFLLICPDTEHWSRDDVNSRVETLARDMMRVTRDRDPSWHPIITRSNSHSCPNNFYSVNWLYHNKHSQLFCANNNIVWITQLIVKSSSLASVLLQETLLWYRELEIQEPWMEVIGLLAQIFQHLWFSPQ